MSSTFHFIYRVFLEDVAYRMSYHGFLRILLDGGVCILHPERRNASMINVDAITVTTKITVGEKTHYCIVAYLLFHVFAQTTLVVGNTFNFINFLHLKLFSQNIYSSQQQKVSLQAFCLKSAQQLYDMLNHFTNSSLIFFLSCKCG